MGWHMRIDSLTAQTPRLTAVLALAMIAAALVSPSDGAQSAAALLGCALSALLGIAIALHPQDRLVAVVRANRLALAGAFAFLVVTLATAALLPADLAPSWLRALWHPRWHDAEDVRGALSMAPLRTLKGLAVFAAPAAAFMLGALNAQDRRTRDETGRLYVALGFVLALLALTGRGPNALLSSGATATLFGVLFLLISAMAARGARGRLTGPVLAPLSASQSPLARLVVNAPASLLGLALCLTLVLRTGSPTAIMALALSALLLCAVTLIGARAQLGALRNLDGAFIVFTVIAALAGLLITLGADAALAAFTGAEGEAGRRAAALDAQWRLFLDRPLLGHGLNTHGVASAPLEGAARNVFVQLLVETGLVGMGLIMVMVGAPLARALGVALNGRAGVEWSAASFAALLFAALTGILDFGVQAAALSAMLAYGVGAFSGAARVQAVVEPRAWEAVEPDLLETSLANARHESDAIARREARERAAEARAARREADGGEGGHVFAERFAKRLADRARAVAARLLRARHQ